MYELRELIPYPEVLLSLPVEELAEKVLTAVRVRTTTPGQNAHFHPNNLASEFSNYTSAQPYPRADETVIAVMEAFSWLESQGLIVEEPKHQSGWKRLTRRAATVGDDKAFKEFRVGRSLPREAMHQRLKQDTWLAYVRGDFDNAIFLATRELEVSVREAGGYGSRKLGVELMREAFKPGGPLCDPEEDAGEQQALSNLFAGMIGRFKNSQSHRIVGVESPEEAIGVIMMASTLLHVVDRVRRQ